MSLTIARALRSRPASPVGPWPTSPLPPTLSQNNSSGQGALAGEPTASPTVQDRVLLLDEAPNKLHVLYSKFLGRFFMRNAKEACNIATVHPTEQIGAGKLFSRMAELTKIAEPKYSRDFRLIDMNLKRADWVLSRVTSNALAEEALARACADKLRVFIDR